MTMNWGSRLLSMYANEHVGCMFDHRPARCDVGARTQLDFMCWHGVEIAHGGGADLLVLFAMYDWRHDGCLPLCSKLLVRLAGWRFWSWSDAFSSGGIKADMYGIYWWKGLGNVWFGWSIDTTSYRLQLAFLPPRPRSVSRWNSSRAGRGAGVGASVENSSSSTCTFTKSLNSLEFIHIYRTDPINLVL
jgi:hypothetical protein